MLATLSAPTPRERLERRAAHFSFENAITSYTELLSGLARPTGHAPHANTHVDAPLPSAPKRSGTPGTRTLHPIIRGLRRSKLKSREGQ